MNLLAKLFSRKPKRDLRTEPIVQGTWTDITTKINMLGDARATDYCKKCGESPESGTHFFDHAYVRP